MPGSDTRQLQLQISASAELMIRNLRQADAEVAKFQASTNSRLTSIDAKFAAVGKLKNGLSGIGQASGVSGLIGAAAGVTLIDLAKRALDYAGSLQEVSQQLGVTAEDLQVYRYAASQAGIDQEIMEKGLQKLTLTLGKAQLGADKPTKAFEALGLSLEKLQGKTAGEAIPLIADALAKIPDPAKRAALEVELFGKAGQRLDGLLAGGAAGISALAIEARQLGLVLSDKEIAEADRTADKLAQVKAVLEANIARGVVDNADAIYQLGNALGALIGKATQAGSAYQGFLRIVQNEGARGFLRTITGDGSDQREAGTARGYSSQKIRELKDATAAYRRAQANPAVPANVRTALRNEAVLARDRALRAVGQQLAEQRSASVATAQARAALKGGGGGDTVTPPKFLASNGGGGKSAEAAKREAEAAAQRDRNDQRRADALVNRSNLDVLDARAEKSLDPAERLKLELERIELARQARDADLDEQAIDNKYIAANLTKLKLNNADVATIEKQLVQRKASQEAEQAVAERRRGAEDDQIELLELAARITDVAKERYAIERRILAAKQAQERQELARIAADKNLPPAERQLAQDRLDRLPARQAAERQALDRQNAGPLDQYFRGLKSEAGDLSEALQGVAVRGLGSIEDETADTIGSLIQIRGAFGGLVNSILADLARLGVRRGLLSLLGSIGGLKSGGSGGAGVFSLGFGGIGSTPGFATGGSLLIGGRGGVDQNELSLNGRPIARVSRGERLNISSGAPSVASIGALNAGSGSGGGSGGAIALRVSLSDDLDARIDNRAAGVAVSVVREAAPAIAQAATDNTISTIKRVRM